QAPATDARQDTQQQDRNRNQAQRRETNDDARMNNQGLSKHLAACVALGNQEEIAISQVGLQRAQNEKVKQFAQQMINDHGKYLSELEQFAPQVAQQSLQSGSRRAAFREGRQATDVNQRDA